MAGQRELMERFSRKMGEVTGQQTETAITRILVQIGMNSASMIPVDTSNLINSEYRKTMPTATGWKGEIGYGAEYALYVHEAPGTLKGKSVERDPNNPSRGVFWSPSGEPKFLEKGANELINSQQLSQIFQQSFKL